MTVEKEDGGKRKNGKEKWNWWRVWFYRTSSDQNTQHSCVLSSSHIISGVLRENSSQTNHHRPTFNKRFNRFLLSTFYSINILLGKEVTRDGLMSYESQLQQTLIRSLLSLCESLSIMLKVTLIKLLLMNHKWQYTYISNHDSFIGATS